MSIERFTPPGWPERVQVLATTREGGISAAPFDTLNLGAHVGDDRECVAENRRRLSAALPDGCAPFWLAQVHGREVVAAPADAAGPCPRADASWTREPGIACAVLTADCLPLLLTDSTGELVAAVHAGWRGLAAGVVEATLKALPVKAAGLRAWLGPAIGPSAFEVGEDVREAFLTAAHDASRIDTGECFRPGHASGKWFADLHALARLRLTHAGVSHITADRRCTFGSSRQFFSYRRDGPTGRMAFLVFRNE